MSIRKISLRWYYWVFSPCFWPQHCMSLHIWLTPGPLSVSFLYLLSISFPLRSQLNGLLHAGNGTFIYTYSTKRLHLKLNFRRNFQSGTLLLRRLPSLLFVLTFFLTISSSLIFITRNIDSEAQFSTRWIRATSSVSGILLPSPGSNCFEALLHSDFSELITPMPTFPEMKNNVIHHIETLGIHSYACAWSLVSDKLVLLS